MKEHEQKDDNLEDEYYIETIDETQPEKEVYDLRAERESMNEKFSWGWFRLEESLIT